MSNLHALPDTLHELMCTWGDLGPAVILSHSGLTVPAASLTLPAVAATGYVRDAARLVYVSQPAVSVTLSGGNGTYWLALHADLSTAVSGWTRRAGSHFVWQMSATQPPGVSGLLGFAQITVAGGVITAVTTLPDAVSPPMSRQNSHAVAITGGTVVAQTVQGSTRGAFGTALNTSYALTVDGQPLWTQHAQVNTALGCGRVGGYPLDVLGITRLKGQTVFGQGADYAPLAANVQHSIYWNKAASFAMAFRQTDSDGPGGEPVTFSNVAGTTIGSIGTTGSATSFNTSSDVRLKHAIQPLTDALTTLAALRPVRWKWNVDDSPGVGFLAHELMIPVPEAVTGLPDEVNDDGSIRPQQVDVSRLVPILTAALQAVLARVQTLEDALGV